MTGLHQDTMAERIGRATQRLAQLHARRQLREMRLATVARARERKLVARRRLELGEAIDRAGFAQWSASDVMGLLLVARDHFGDADAARKLMRERAKQANQHISTQEG